MPRTKATREEFEQVIKHLPKSKLLRMIEERWVQLKRGPKIVRYEYQPDRASSKGVCPNDRNPTCDRINGCNYGRGYVPSETAGKQ